MRGAFTPLLHSDETWSVQIIENIEKMKKNRVDKGRIIENGRGLGTVTREMLAERASELAVLNGRTADNVLDSDFEQARRELTGMSQEPGVASPRSERVPEDERWDPVPGSKGHRAPTVPPADETTATQELVEEGVDEAEQDLMNQATKESLERDAGTEP